MRPPLRDLPTSHPTARCGDDRSEATAAACVAGATAGNDASLAGAAFKQVGKWGKSGTANGQFRNPFGIATDRAGNVYVADTDNNRVQVFSASGAFLRKWGSNGSGNGQFLSAQDVAVDPQGGIWVADYRNDRVQRFSAAGAFQQPIASSQPPESVSTPRATSTSRSSAAE